MKTKRKTGWALFHMVGLLVLVAGCGFDAGATGDGSIAIMTWNVQLLFDGVDDGTEFREFRASAGWTHEKYLGRLNVMARAIEGMERVPDIIALQEIESARVVADLAGVLSAHRYNWTHFARLPGMALGVGLLSRYPLEWAMAHSVDIDGDVAPRPVLEVRMNLAPGVLPDGVDADSFSLALFVCHWKSKRGGADETESTRRASARVILRRIRELARTNPNLPVIVIGDLNVTHDEFVRGGGATMRSLMPDEPGASDFALAYFRAGNPGAGVSVPAHELQRDFLVVSHVKPPVARYFPEGVSVLYSPWTVEKEGGSFFFRNAWETIDHFLLSAQLFDGVGWEFHDSLVLAVPPFVNAHGLPNAYNPRTGRGISDHLPLMLFLRLAE